MATPAPKTPANYSEMQNARDAQAALFDNISFLIGEFDLVNLHLASFSNLCRGCTDPQASNYDPLAEVDDNTCL
jgi:hypothetical protein